MITTIDLFTFGARAAEIFSAFVVVAVMIWVLNFKDIALDTRKLAWGIMCTSGSFAVNRSYWFVGRWFKEHGREDVYANFVFYSPFLTLTTLLFIFGCAWHIRSMTPNGSLWMKVFLIANFLVALGTASQV